MSSSKISATLIAMSLFASSAQAMGDPSYKYCTKNGGVFTKTEQDPDGSGEYGVCVFPDGSECGTWAFFHGECKQGDSKKKIGMPNPASEYCLQHGGILQPVTDSEGNQSNDCLTDCEACEEWDYYHGKCELFGNSGSSPNNGGGRRKNRFLMTNPASTKCERDGGITSNISDPDGNQYGVCTMCASQCDEWDFYHNGGVCLLGGGDSSNGGGRRLRGDLN